MPLCDACLSEAEVTRRDGTATDGERVETLPPHGMDWGESCDRCSNRAVVMVR